jgi:hypothetical protein
VLTELDHGIANMLIELSSIVNLSWIEKIAVGTRLFGHAVNVPYVEAYVEQNEKPVAIEEE